MIFKKTLLTLLCLILPISVNASDVVNLKKIESIPTHIEDLAKNNRLIMAKESFVGFLFSATEDRGKGFSLANFHQFNDFSEGSDYKEFEGIISDFKQSKVPRQVDQESFSKLSTYISNKMTDYLSADRYILKNKMNAPVDAADGFDVNSGFFGSSIMYCSGRVPSEKGSEIIARNQSASYDACILQKNIKEHSVARIKLDNASANLAESLAKSNQLMMYLVVKRDKKIVWTNNGFTRFQTRMTAEQVYIGDAEGNLIAGYELPTPPSVVKPKSNTESATEAYEKMGKVKTLKTQSDSRMPPAVELIKIN